jgi:dihydropyrimidinase
MLDLLIRNGVAVTPAGSAPLDVGIQDGRIVLLLERDSEAPECGQEIDASGNILVPGGIDPHVHTSWLIPTAAKEGLVCAPPEDVSLAAIHGGTTMILDFATWLPGETLVESLSRKESDWYGNAYTDYAYHCILRGELPFEVIEEIPEAIAAGHPSFKVFMTNTTPSRPPQKIGIGDIWGILDQLARHDGILAVHGEDDDIVMFSYRRLAHEGRWAFENVHLAHNSLSEALSFRRLINLLERVGGRVYFMHVSAEEGVRAIREAQAAGLPVYAETLQHYLSFTWADYKRPNGAVFHTYPSLKSAEDQAALWDGLNTGTIQCVATDEMCTSLEVKLRGHTVDDVTGGHAGVEVRMGLMYTEAVVKRGMSLEDFVGMTSTNAAKIFGMYPRKGAIAVGSDADIAILDPSLSRKLTASDLHETDYTPWEGWEVRGWPVTTILRGKVMVHEGELQGKRGDGTWIARKLASATCTPSVDAL